MTSRRWWTAWFGLGGWARCVRVILVGVSIWLSAPHDAVGQTVQGTLVDIETSASIPWGLVLMFSEAGDSIGATLTDAGGDFAISAPRAGSYVLRAGALGYEERAAGVFDLGAGGVVTLRYGLRPRPLPIDELVVSLDRPATLHHRVRNGFVTRLQRGLGVFVTPYQIEQSSARSTEQLLTGLPGIRVGPAYTKATDDLPEGEIGVLLPRPDLGESILVNGRSGWCAPTLYVDGVRTFYDPDGGLTLSNVAGIGEIEGIEVYRRSAEIPVEYTSGPGSNCGVIVAWTRTGLAPGQRGSGSRGSGPAGAGERLPATHEVGEPPEIGEDVRMEVRGTGPELATAILEGSLVLREEESLVVRDRATGRNLVVGIEEVGALQVRRARSPSDAYVRGGIAGMAMAVTTWGGLTFLCEWSECNGAAEHAWVPAAIGGALVGYVAYRRGPRAEWMNAAIPDVAPGPGGVAVAWRVPAAGRHR